MEGGVVVGGELEPIKTPRSLGGDAIACSARNQHVERLETITAR
jgi:hypothetical protein